MIDLVSSDDDAAGQCGAGAPEVISLDSPQVRPQASPAPVPVASLPRSLGRRALASRLIANGRAIVSSRLCGDARSLAEAAALRHAPLREREKTCVVPGCCLLRSKRPIARHQRRQRAAPRGLGREAEEGQPLLRSLMMSQTRLRLKT